MNQELSPDALQKILEEHTARLMENFDSVTILTTAYNSETGDTEGYESDGGNLYARIGRAQEWLTKQDQYVRTRESKRWSKEK